METTENMNSLVAEYGALLDDAARESSESVAQVLVRKGDWTDEGAAHLVSLAENYGSFVLRNALALALAMRIEDGTLGL